MVEQGKSRMTLVGLHGCPACDSLEAQLSTQEVRDTLKERFGTSEYDKLYLDEKSEGGARAADIVASLDVMAVPLLVVEKEGKVCLLDEDLKEQKCAQLVELPKE